MALTDEGIIETPGLSLHPGKPADVEEILLRVHRADLATDLGQRVQYGDAQTPETGVVRAEQADRPGAHDEDVVGLAGQLVSVWQITGTHWASHMDGQLPSNSVGCFLAVLGFPFRGRLTRRHQK